MGATDGNGAVLCTYETSYDAIGNPLLAGALHCNDKAPGAAGSYAAVIFVGTFGTAPGITSVTTDHGLGPKPETARTRRA